MADAASGGDEIKRIILRAEALNFAGVQKEVLSLNLALQNLAKTLKSGGGLNKAQISEINAELNKVGQMSQSAGMKTKASLQQMDAAAKRLNTTLNNTGQLIGAKLTGKSTDKAAMREWTKGLSDLGVGIVANPKYVAQVVGNVTRINDALKTGRNAGIATKASIDALSTGRSVSMPMVTNMQRLSVNAAVARKGLEGVVQGMMDTAKKSQWTGRQMMEGITFPLGAIGLSALRTFDSINKELIQLKKVTEYKEDYGALEGQIKSLGATYGVSMKSSAALFTNIAALGKSGDDIQKWADAIAKVSMVGDIELGGATEFFRVVNAIFAGGSIQKTNEIMAQLSAISDETSLQLRDLAQAFPEVAPVMQQMGFSAAGVASSLAGMYRRGIPATEAAHGLKFALQRLIVPTKDSQKIIDQLGFSFTDANGKVKDGAVQIMLLAEKFKGMSDAQKLAAAPELFGARQSARMNSYFADVQLGNEEYRKLKAGIISVNDVQSDFLRGMIASGEIPVEGVVDAVSRYERAVKEIQKDPSKALAKIKSQMQAISFEIGKAMAPAVISVGEALVDMLKKFTELSPSLQKIIIGFGALVAAMGPIRYIFAQARYTVASFVGIFLKGLPKMVEIAGGAAQANALIAAGYTNLAQVGNKFAMVDASIMDRLLLKLGIVRSSRKAIFDAMEAQNAEMAASNTVVQSSEDEVSDELVETTAAATARASATEAVVASNMAMDASNRKAANSLNNLRNPFDEVRDAQKKLADERNEILKAGGFEPTGAKSGAKYRKGGKFVKQSEADDFVEEQLSAKRRTERSRRLAEEQQKKMSKFQELMRKKAEADRIKKLPPPPDMPKTGKFAKIFGGVISKIAPEGGKVAGLASKFKLLIPVIGLLSIKIIAIIAVIAIVVGSIYAFVKVFRDNWDAFVKAIQPGIEAIKKAFGKVKEAVGGLVSTFTSVLSQLGTGTDEAGQAASMVEGVGGVISKIFEGLAKAMEFIGVVIGALKPFIESIAYTIKNVIGFISSLFSGEWKQALMYFLAFGYELVRPVLLIFDIVAKGIAQAMSSILAVISAAIKKIPDPFGWLNGVPEQIDQAQKAIEGFSDAGIVNTLDENLRGLGGSFKKASNTASKDAEKAGGDLGKDLNEGINAEVGSGGSSWVGSWVSKVYSALDKEIERAKKSALDSLQKSHDAALLVYEDRIKAIEDQEKAEQKLFKTQEYLAKKKELLSKRELDRDNYLKERGLAIYEGRYNDARMLDIQEQKNKNDYNTSLADIENSRAKDLLQEQRDYQKEIINLEKETAQKRFEELRKAAETYIDIITQYHPATVDEFQSMLDSITQIISNSGGSWEESGISAMDRFAYAMSEANKQVADEFLTAGKDARTNWMIGFASAGTVAILASEAGGGGGGGGYGDKTPDNTLPDGFSAADVGPFGPAGFAGVELPFGPILEEMKKESGIVFEGMTLEGVTSAKIISREWSKNSKYVNAYIDELGNRWENTTTGIVNQYGETAKKIIDQNGDVVRIQLEGSSKMFEANKNTYTSALNLANEMTEKGIRPGTEAAKGFESKLRDIGFAVEYLDGKNVLVNFDIDTKRFNARMDYIREHVDPTTGFVGLGDLIIAGNMFNGMATGGMFDASKEKITRFATGGLVKSKKNGILAQIGEGGFDEFVITTDPKYRASNIGYLLAAASKLGIKAAAGAAISSASNSSIAFKPSSAKSSEYGGSSGDVYISVDTFIGQEQWFAEMAKKYNMKTVPRERKIAGQQKRVISSYNNRWDVK